MRPWELLDSTMVPGEGSEMRLYRRGEEYSIKTGYTELMNSRIHGSEDALAELACQRLNDKDTACVLIGGLGMGFTAATALQQLGPEAKVTVAELVPSVIQWNREYLSALANHPLKDPRIKIIKDDVGKLIRQSKNSYDAILLDVDNGPEGLSRKENNSLYSPDGLNAAIIALKPDGIFGVWSISPDQHFFKKLQQAGFKVEEIRARARGKHGGGKHMIWLGKKRK